MSLSSQVSAFTAIEKSVFAALLAVEIPSIMTTIASVAPAHLPAVSGMVKGAAGSPALLPALVSIIEKTPNLPSSVPAKISGAISKVRVTTPTSTSSVPKLSNLTNIGLKMPTKGSAYEVDSGQSYVPPAPAASTGMKTVLAVGGVLGVGGILYALLRRRSK